MFEGERYLLIITKNKSSVILEGADPVSLERLQAEAESNRAVCKRILIDDFYPTFSNINGLLNSKFFI